MKPNSRFIKSIVATAQASDTAMPWSRGARRASFIASRSEKPAPLRVKTA